MKEWQRSMQCRHGDAAPLAAPAVIVHSRSLARGRNIMYWNLRIAVGVGRLM